MLAEKTQKNWLQQYLTPKRRKLFSKLWILIVLIYDAIRALVISHSLSKYGINGVYYFIFEITISIPYSICSFRFVMGLVDGKKINIYLYGMLTAILFFAPDLYVLLFANNPPLRVYAYYGLFLCFTTTVSVFGIFKEVKKKSREKANA
ncbi:MAG: hypothetical protein U0R17_00265 [Acidimicrobiia bacterium]